MNELFGMADQLRTLSEKKKALADETKETNAAIKELSEQMVALMVEEEVSKFSRDGKLFHLRTKFYARPKPARKVALYRTLKEEGFGDIIQETINSNTLNSFIKEQIEENDDEMPEWLEGLVKTYEETTVGMRKG